MIERAWEDIVAKAIADHAPDVWLPDVLLFLKHDGQPTQVSPWEMAWAMFNEHNEEGALNALATALTEHYGS